MRYLKFIIIALSFLLCKNTFAQEQLGVTFDSIIKLDTNVNSDAEEIVPLVSANGLELMFARYLHPDNMGGKEAGHDIWVAKKEELKDNWKKAENAIAFNTTKHDAVVGYSNSGNELYLLNNPAADSFGISIIDLKNGLEKRYEKVNLPADCRHIYGVHVSIFENWALFSLQIDSLDSGFDIFLFQRNANEWEAIKRLGINSESDEHSPFIAHDSTLYFASNRSGGMGGFDIYYTKPTDNTFEEWTDAKNIGDKINSSGFDAYFSMTKDSTFYFVSNRESRLSDIYSGTMQPLVMPEPLNITKTDTTLDRDYIEQKITDLKIQLATNDQTIPEYVYFEFDSTRITTEAANTLHSFIAIIKYDSLVAIELQGHADSIGSQAYNRALSAKRSKSVREFLRSNGVNDLRIRTIGYGESSPIADNSTEEGRAKNRRVRLVLFRE